MDLNKIASFLRTRQESAEYLKKVAKDKNIYIRVSCRIPDDYIDARRYPLLAAREVMRQVVDDLLGRSTFAPGALA